MKKTGLNILMLEDDPLDAELNKEQLLLLEEYNCAFKVVDNKMDYLESLESFTPDIILCDYSMPRYNGLEALNDLKKHSVLIPFIFVTGTMKEEIAADAIKAGAWDYVVKDRLFRLSLAVRSVLKLKEEKEIAASALERINRLLMAVEQTSTQIIVMDKDSNIEYANKKFTEVSGYKLEDVLGKPGQILDSGDENKGTFSKIMKTMRKGEVYKGEALSRKKDGTQYWELISITPIKNPKNEITNYIAVKEDITLRKEMEQELISARDKAEQSDRLKDAFLQNMSHEIRTPLNAIVGFSELLHERTDCMPESLQHYSSIILKSSNQLLSIVTDILTMASIQTGQEILISKPVSVTKLFEELYRIFLPLAEEKGIALKCTQKSENKDLIISTDETKLIQILTNLLNNAIKFTHKGFIEFYSVLKNNTVEFYVKDTGIGIKKEFHDLIFERFRQADATIHINYGGTGLGLSISKSFAELLGGTIRVESKPDSGSVFCLTVPYTPSEAETDVHIPESSKLAQLPLQILIAEDEYYNYMLLESYLNRDNITLHHVYNGLDALEICKNNPDIDLVLMDIKMPVMDGITSFREIKKIRKTLPVIAQTAYALENDKKELLKLGFTDYISKPIKLENLIDKINNVFDMKD